MLFFWRKNREIDNFALSLADELYSQVPPSMLEMASVSAKEDKKFARRWEKEIQATIIRLRDYKDLHRLGVYGKARLHLTFMERLRKHGYPDNIVKELNDLLLVKTP